jgi:hypothetical protein
MSQSEPDDLIAWNKATLDSLPELVLRQILSYSGSFNLAYICRTLHISLSGLRNSLLAAILPPR